MYIMIIIYAVLCLSFPFIFKVKPNKISFWLYVLSGILLTPIIELIIIAIREQYIKKNTNGLLVSIIILLIIIAILFIIYQIDPNFFKNVPNR